MASEMVIPGASFNSATDMKYTNPKVNSVVGRSVGIVNAKTSTVLNLSSPLMLTWGVQSFTDDKSGKVSYDLALQFPNEGFETPATKRFLENMSAFEKKIKEDAITNSKEWFSKPKMTADAVDALWTPVLKYPKNKDTLEADTSRAPTIKVKLPFWDGAWKELELYDVDMQPVFPDPMNPSLAPQDLIAKGSHIAVSIQCGGIWFANGKFGVTWKLFQAIVKPKMSLKGKCHIKLDDEDKTKIVSQVVPTDVDGDADEDLLIMTENYHGKPEDKPLEWYRTQSNDHTVDKLFLNNGTAGFSRLIFPDTFNTASGRLIDINKDLKKETNSYLV